MKTSILLSVALASCAFPWASFAADDLPKPQVFARYEAMMNKSPFAVATAAAPPPPPAPNFAKDLYIANAAKLADEAIVTLASNVDKALKEYVTTKAPNKNGYSISNVEWSDRVGATKVTITKDGQFATLAFNQALLSQPVTSGAAQALPQPSVQVPGSTSAQLPGVAQPQSVPAATPLPVNTTPTINNTVRPAPIPTLPTPPPRVRGVIQRNPNGTAANGTVQPDVQEQ